MKQQFPVAVSIVVGEALGAHYYNHRQLNALFAGAGAPGAPPEGGCSEKCVAWLKRVSADPDVDALSVLGRVLEEYMEAGRPRFGESPETFEKQRANVRETLERYGLSYSTGGHVFGAASAPPTRALDDMLRKRDFVSLEAEFHRSIRTVDSDPPAAITAACATIESLCKVYLDDEGVALPSDQSVKPLWKTVQGHLGLDPGQVADDDLKRILSGLTSIVDGLGALRTHVGSAHGRGRSSYRAAPRHARLALHAAHSLTYFVLETWSHRKSAPTS